MIDLAFTIQRKVIRFRIEDRKIFYFDDNWKDGIQIMPMNTPEEKLAVRKMIKSRKQSISAMGLLIADTNLGKEKKEYDMCKTEEELAEMIRKDMKLKGGLEIK